MKHFGICALFAAGVSAIPMAAPKHGHQHHHQKRDVVWVTETAIDVVTVPVIRTVYWNGHSYSTDSGSLPTTTIVSTATVHPVAYTSSAAPESSSSVVYSAPASSAPESTSSAAYTPSTSAYVAPTTSSSSSSVYVAPTTSSTTSEYSAPAYTAPSISTYVAPTTSSSSSAAATSSASSGGSGAPAGSYSGADLTFYFMEGGTTSCGNTPTDSDYVVAIPENMMDKATMCGKQIDITYNGVTAKGTVMDSCYGCMYTNNIDLTPALFDNFGAQSQGRLHGATWSWSS